MVIDTSAVIAILLAEPERRAFIELIEEAAISRISVATYVEASIVIESRFGAIGLRDFEEFLRVAEVELTAMDAEQAQMARRGYAHFGKGRHRAGLNYGDCFSYALAMVYGESLLCKGDDFIHSDVKVASAN